MWTLGLGLVLMTTPVFAHHEILAKVDNNKRIKLRGFLTEIDWKNPHVHIFINVPVGGSTTNWAIELESTVELDRNGWKRDTLKIGDGLTVDGIAARDGSHQAWANAVVLSVSGRRVFDTSRKQASASSGNKAVRPTPRWPDGHPRLGPPPGETGYWGSPSATSLVQMGVNVQVDAYGLLRNIADVGKVAPFQDWARDLYSFRQRNFLKDDPSFVTCQPPGGPRQFQLPNGVQFAEDLARQRYLVLIGGGNHNFRIIYMDGRPQKGQLSGDADNPLYYGRAAGKWEGDTLVVDLKNFNEQFWFSNGGLPHTNQLHLVERISRPDFNTLKYDLTIDDPGAYTKTWSTSWTLKWVPDEELSSYYCQDNRP